MKMPNVTKCRINDCAYNQEQSCHATAITIGGRGQPNCDTFCRAAVTDKAAAFNFPAHVSVCTVTRCMYNSALQCQAFEIAVGSREHLPECLNYQRSYVGEAVVGERFYGAGGPDSRTPGPEIFIG